MTPTPPATVAPEPDPSMPVVARLSRYPEFDSGWNVVTDHIWDASVEVIEVVRLSDARAALAARGALADERAAFEAWAAPHGLIMTYSDMAWVAWKARAALAAQVAPAAACGP